MATNFKYSIWSIEHESVYTVMAYKIKDTNSSKELEKYESEGYSTSFYRKENELNAMYIQFFNED